MKNKMGCFSYFFTALLFFALFGGCATIGERTAYFPKSLQTTPITELVKVTLPNKGKLVAIDRKQIHSAPAIYVSPGNHTYTFSIKYRSKNYCSGPLSGQRARHDRVYSTLSGSSSQTTIMLGEYSMDVFASEGQTIKMVYMSEPDCKYDLTDYFRVSYSGGRTVYFSKSLEGTPITKLVKVTIPNGEKLIAIDGSKILSAPAIYVSPGNHTYTFSIKYRSSHFCSGPLSGQKANGSVYAVYDRKTGKKSQIATMDGKYRMEVSAEEGQTIGFAYKPEPDCKSDLTDYFRVVIAP